MIVSLLKEEVVAEGSTAEAVAASCEDVRTAGFCTETGLNSLLFSETKVSLPKQKEETERMMQITHQKKVSDAAKTLIFSSISRILMRSLYMRAAALVTSTFYHVNQKSRRNSQKLT